jgi:hypothetical protein
MLNPITVIESNDMRFPVFYDGLFRAYWTPKFARYYDTIEELEESVKRFTANIVIL